MTVTVLIPPVPPRCLSCNAEIERCLALLGSLTCHDCRPPKEASR